MMRAWWLVGCVAFGCDKLFSIDSFSPIDAAPPLRPPIAYYPMEAIGSTPTHCMTDASGHGHDGTCISGFPTLTPGPVGMAYQFDGMVHIHIGAAPDLDVSAGTVAFFAKIGTGALGGCPVNRVHAGVPDDSWQICTHTDTILYVAYDGSLVVPMVIKPDEWHHYAITFGNGMMEAWLDAVSLGQKPANVQYDDHDMVLGADIDNGTVVEPIVGALDEVQVYDQVLSRGQLDMLATAP